MLIGATDAWDPLVRVGEVRRAHSAGSSSTLANRTRVSSEQGDCNEQRDDMQHDRSEDAQKSNRRGYVTAAVAASSFARLAGKAARWRPADGDVVSPMGGT